MEIHKDRLPGSRRLRILESQEKAQKAEQEARESLANYQQMTKNYTPSGPMIPGDVVGVAQSFNVAGVTIYRRYIGTCWEYSFYIGDRQIAFVCVQKSCE